MTKAHDNRLGYRKSAESAANGGMRPKAQIRMTVKFDETKTNKCSEQEQGRAELVWNDKMQC